MYPEELLCITKRKVWSFLGVCGGATRTNLNPLADAAADYVAMEMNQNDMGVSENSGLNPPKSSIKK